MSATPRGAMTWLTGSVLVLALALAVLWLAPGAPARWRHWPAPAPQAPTLDDVHAAVLVANPAATAAYPEVLKRPLMSPTRRPQAAAAPAPAASAPPPSAIEQLKLLGIVDGPALSGVMIEQDGKTSFVRRGERVGGWTLDSLQDRTASFVRQGERHRLELPVTHAAAEAQNAPATRQPAARVNDRPARAAPAPAVAPPAPAATKPPASAASAALPSKPVGSFGGGARQATPPR